MRYIAGESYRAHSDPLFIRNSSLKITDLYKQKLLCLLHTLSYGSAPPNLSDYFTKKPYFEPMYLMRGNKLKVILKRVIKTSKLKMPSYQGVRLWNNLPLEFVKVPSRSSFRVKLTDRFLASYA